MEEKFDYTKAMAELEKIAVKVEDPDTALEDIDACIRRSEQLVEQCRAYLRTAREKIDGKD